MQYQEYYQIGGFQAQIKDSYDSKDSLGSKALFGPNGLDLVLGIRPTGASYLLVPRNRQRQIFPHIRPLGRPSPAETFLSLSPIHFVNTAALDAKLQTLVSNKKTSRGQAPRDRSKANTSYTAGGEGLTEAGLARTSFEHQRVLNMLLRNTLLDTSDYALYPASWIGKLRLTSLAYNTWLFGNSGDNPVILDIAWTEFTLPSPGSTFGIKSTVHCIPEENRLQSNPKRKRLEFQFGITETVKQSAAASRLQDFLGTRGQDARPIILFVHDALKTMKILSALNINTVHWNRSIFDILYSRPGTQSRISGTLKREQGTSQSYSQSYQESRGGARSRSRSPKRETSDFQQRPRSPISRSEPSDLVYVVDIRQLFQTMKQVSSVTDTVFDNARTLSVHDVPNLASEGAEHSGSSKFVPQDGMCAGHESRLLGLMWYSMAGGPPIDEQRSLRDREIIYQAGGIGAPSTAPAANGSEAPGSDEEVDPNDIVRPAQQGGATIMDPAGWDDYSDEDW